MGSTCSSVSLFENSQNEGSSLPRKKTFKRHGSLNLSSLANSSGNAVNKASGSPKGRRHSKKRSQRKGSADDDDCTDINSSSNNSSTVATRLAASSHHHGRRAESDEVLQQGNRPYVAEVSSARNPLLAPKEAYKDEGALEEPLPQEAIMSAGQEGGGKPPRRSTQRKGQKKPQINSAAFASIKRPQQQPVTTRDLLTGKENMKLSPLSRLHVEKFRTPEEYVRNGVEATSAAASSNFFLKALQTKAPRKGTMEPINTVPDDETPQLDGPPRPHRKTGARADSDDDEGNVAGVRVESQGSDDIFSNIPKLEVTRQQKDVVRNRSASGSEGGSRSGHTSSRASLLGASRGSPSDRRLTSHRSSTATAAEPPSVCATAVAGGIDDEQML